MDVCVVVFPGTNREGDMVMALEKAMGARPRLVWHKETDVGKPDLIVLPGGFSYGDYLRCGAMAARAPVMRDVIDKAQKGIRILGVCNGFQILVESGLLPGALLRNRSLRFLCRRVHVRCETAHSDFTHKIGKGARLEVPVAHGEGNYFADEKTLKTLEDQDRIAFRYCDSDGQITPAANCNGSLNNIAGILSHDRTILGMMPHPENATHPWHANQTGQTLFQSLTESLM